MKKVSSINPLPENVPTYLMQCRMKQEQKQEKRARVRYLLTICTAVMVTVPVLWFVGGM